MTEHFTRNTVSASLWCPKCQKFTQHSIDHGKEGGGRKGVCQECVAKLEANRELELRRVKQANLFGEST
jgi:uncharacterized paraquat-inducible protein A